MLVLNKQVHSKYEVASFKIQLSNFKIQTEIFEKFIKLNLIDIWNFFKEQK